MTADPNGWPDEARPGVPLNPEHKGKHWLSGAVWNWYPEDQAFSDDDGRRYWPSPIVARHFQYEGPCLTPQEVAALVAETRAKAQAEAKRLPEAWLRVIQSENTCAVTGRACGAKRCGCAAEQDMLIREALDEAAAWHDERAAREGGG